MTKEQYLEQLIINQYKSILAFSKACGVPDSTIQSALKNGIEKTSVKNLASMVKALGITMESIVSFDEKDKEKLSALAKSSDANSIRIILEKLPPDEVRAIRTLAEYIRDKSDKQ